MLAAMLGVSSPAHAAFTTFVSGNGDDNADCLTPATACRQITAAIDKTTAGGVVAVLPGDYAPFTLGLDGEQVDVIAQDGLAMVTGSLLPVPGGGNAAILVNVNAAGSMPIKIHGFTLSAGGGGIVILGNSPEVFIENCTIVQAGPENGIDFRPSNDTGELHITNTTVSRAVGSPSGIGIRIRPSGGTNAEVVLENTRIENSSIQGMLVDGRTTTGYNEVTIRDSVLSANHATGLHAVDSGGGTTDVMVERTTAASNGTQGFVATGGNAVIRMRDSTSTGNGRGLQGVSGGQIVSHGGNVIAGNTVNGVFTSTLPQQ
jgi:hypothetical protein